MTADAALTKVYGQDDPELTYQITEGELVDGESLTGELEREAGENAGSYAIIQGDLAAGSNYSISFTSADFAITPKTLSIAANAGQNKVYGETDPTFTYSANGFEFTDDEDVINGSLSRESGDDVGDYALEIGDLDVGDNYTIDYTGADFQITQRTLNLSNFTADGKTYDGTTELTGAGFEDDRVGGDELAFTYDVGFVSANAGTGVAVNYTNLAISGGADQDNYELASTTGSATANITQRELTIVADGQTKVYGAADPGLTYQITEVELVEGESLEGELSRESGEGVESYAITQGDLTAGDNYTMDYTGADLEITRKELTVTVDAGLTKVYGQDDPELTYSATGFSDDDDENENIFSGSLSRASGETVGTYEITQGDLVANGNYSISFTSDNLEITPKTLAVTANAGQNKVYGETDPTFTYSANGFEFTDDEDVINGSLSRESGDDVGDYALEIGDLDVGDNYTIDYTGADFQITQRTLNLSNFTADGKTYDGTTELTGAGFEDDRVGGDELAFTYDVGFVSANAGTGVAVNYTNLAISGGEDQDNYTLAATTTGSATADINPRALEITADAGQSKVYGEDDPDLNFEITSGSLVVGDELTGTLERATGEAIDTYAISQGDLSAGGNYAISYTGDDFTITPRELTITADNNQSKVYGEADPTFTFNATGFSDGDGVSSILTGALARDAGEDAGDYTITGGDLAAGSNYTITFNSAEFSIDPKTLTVTTDSGLEKIYGDDEPELTFQASGFAGGDDEDILSGVLAREDGENAGGYEILQGDLSTGTNYTIDFEGEAFTITARTLVLSNFTAGDKTYDGNTETQGSFDDDRIGDDGLSFDYQVAFEDKNVGDDKQVEFTQISLGGAFGANYQLESTTGAASASITPQELSIAADDVGKEFGEADPELSYQVTEGELLEGEQLSGSLERQAGEGVGSYAIGRGSLTAGDNYSITFNEAEFTIEGKELLVQAEEDQQKTYGEDDPEFIFEIVGFGHDDDESILSGTLSREEGEQAGTYEITLGNMEASDNYQLSIESAEFTINRAELVLEADSGLTKFVGEADSVFTYQYSGFAFDDEESLFEGALSREEGEGFGSYAITLGTLSAGTNYSITFTGAEFRILRTSPVIVERSPETDAPEAALDVAIYADFDQEIRVGDETKITLADETGQPVEVTVESDGERVELTHDGLSTVTQYRVEFEAGAIENMDSIANAAMSWSFTTIVQIPEPVVLSSPADSTGSVSLTQSLDFNWQEEGVAESYEFKLSTDPEFTEPIYESGAIEDESLVYGDPLTPGQGYFWRVRAVNKAGTGPWSEPGLFVTSLATPVLTFPEDDAVEISTAPNLQWEKGIEASTSNLRFSSDSLFVEDVIDVVAESNAYLVEALDAEQTYYWQVRDSAVISGVSTLSDSSGIYAFTTRPDPEDTEDEPVTVTINFGNTSGSGEPGEPGGNPDEQTAPQQIDYRMVGLPGTDGIRLDEFFEGPYRDGWRAFYETGAETNFYDEYEEDDPRFTFTPGLGFWMLSTDIIADEFSFSAVQTDAADTYGIAVHPGWNIIANPFQSPVEWSLVESFNEISSPLYGYAQAFVQVDTLQPFAGYYYYNDPALDKDNLYIPYTGYDQRGTAKVASKADELLKDTPQIKLILSSKEQAISEVNLITNLPATKSGGINLDRLHPNLEQAKSGMVVTGDQASRLRYNRMEVEPAGDLPYHLEAKTDVGRHYSWSLKTVNQPDGEAVLLVNKATLASFIVTSGQPARVKATEPISRFELFIGDEQELLEKQESLLPATFELSQNYPNPFNPATNIRFSVPERAQVTLEIYDILGRKVQTLVSQAMQPGWHVVSWNASQLSSGMYLYRLQAGNAVFTKKLTLIK
ncbi:MAG: MBG domain-containing protein [Balneolaceae bacterium]